MICSADSAARRPADRALRECASELGHGFAGGVMYMGTRVGGASFWPTYWRWGYGYPYPATGPDED